MDTIVTKFGGSSVANAQALCRWAISSGPMNVAGTWWYRPRQADSKDHKITDTLLMCYQLASHRLGFENVFSIIAARYRDIHRTLGLTQDLETGLTRCDASAPEPAVITAPAGDICAPPDGGVSGSPVCGQQRPDCI